MDDRLAPLVLAWLDRSKADLGAARVLLASKEAYVSVAAFHCQQAAEKALKAYLASKDEPILKTHDLEVLVEACEVFNPDFRSFRPLAADLTPFAVEFRYPSSSPEPTLAEARGALDRAQKLYNHVYKKLGLTPA